MMTVWPARSRLDKSDPPKRMAVLDQITTLFHEFHDPLVKNFVGASIDNIVPPEYLYYLWC